MKIRLRKKLQITTNESIVVSPELDFRCAFLHTQNAKNVLLCWWNWMGIAIYIVNPIHSTHTTTTKPNRSAAKQRLRISKWNIAIVYWIVFCNAKCIVLFRSLLLSSSLYIRPNGSMHILLSWCTIANIRVVFIGQLCKQNEIQTRTCLCETKYTYYNMYIESRHFKCVPLHTF